jgi:predicted ABC-class ATPase
MEHIEVLNMILGADKKAKALTDTAIEKREHLSEDIEREKEKLRDEHMKRARERVEAEFARERALSNQMIAELDEKLKRDTLEVDRKLAARRESLADMVFSMIMEDAE